MRLMRIVNFLIVIGVAIAIVLGFALVYKTYIEKKPATEQNETASAPTEAQRQSLKPTYTPEELSVLQTPDANSSAEEQSAFSELVFKIAKPADHLDITECKPTPIVMSTQDGGVLKVRNADPIEHVLVIDKDHVYPIPANGTADVEVEFGKGGGIYGYGCDASSEAVGILLINQ